MHRSHFRCLAPRRSRGPATFLCAAFLAQVAAGQVPHANRQVRAAVEGQTASTMLAWGSIEVLVGADGIRGVYIGTISKGTGGMNPSCPTGNWYDPASVQRWIPTADSVIRAADPDTADVRKSTQTQFLPDRSGGGLMLGRLRASPLHWAPSATLYFADSFERGQLTLEGNRQVAQDLLLALARAAATSAVVEDGQDPRARVCDQYIQLSSATAAGVQPVQLKAMPAPSVPDSFIQAGLDGLVLVRYVVLPTGRVDAITADFVFASHLLLIPPVRAALWKAQFEPARKDGTPIPMCVSSAFRFRTRH